VAELKCQGKALPAYSRLLKRTARPSAHRYHYTATTTVKMANPAAGANLAQALTDHERLKRSTDMPLYFGRKEKDTITARHLIERIEKGAVIAAWDAARKCNELYMLLRDKAMVWYESLVDEELDLQDWDVVKREFLKTYEPKYSARTTCANFSDLVQKPGETINDFHVRVQTAYKRITDSKPATMAAVRLAGATPDQAKLEGMKDMAKFFKHQLFLAGLSDNLRDKVLEAKKDTFTESLDLARELESIQLDHRRSQKIAAVKAELQTGFNLRGPSLLPKAALMDPGTKMSCAVTVKRKGTCKRNVAPVKETRLQWWMPMARPTTTVSTMWPKRTPSPNRSTRMPMLGLLPTLVPTII